MLAFKWSHLGFELNTILRGSGNSHIYLSVAPFSLWKPNEEKGSRDDEERGREQSREGGWAGDEKV